MSEYTDLDDLAYKLFYIDYNPKDIYRNKPFFVKHKDYIPYKDYYGKAKIKIRIYKLNKIINEHRKE